MKRLIPLAIILLVFFVACGKSTPEKTSEEAAKPAEPVQPVDPRVEKLAQLATELKAAAQEGVEVPDEKCQLMSDLLKLVLPEITQDLAGCEWDVSCSKNTEDKDILFTVYLNRTMEETKDQPMWFHIIYNPHMSAEDRENYGSDVCNGYKATISENAHLWVLVNNMEIRAIADTEDFKNDEKIKSVVSKFDFKEIEKL